MWQSKLQTTASTSSMQAEYQAMYAGMQELVWLRGVLGEIGRPEDEPTPFFIDSQSAPDLALYPVFHKRSKRIEIKYHWIREHVGIDGGGTAKLVLWSLHIMPRTCSPRCFVVRCLRHKPA